MPKRDPYPCPIYLDSAKLSGWGIIMRGHNLTPAQVKEAVAACEPGAVPAKTEEFHFICTPRVMHCSRYGDSCEMDSEWHTHWAPISTNNDPNTHFTVASYVHAKNPVLAR